MENRSVNQSEMLNRIVRAVILIVVSLLLSIMSVSFAVHHMRLQFEDEFKGISSRKIEQVCDLVKITVNGDEVIGDPASAASKYSDIFSLMLAETSTRSVTTESYAMFLYSDGQLSLLLSHNADSAENFAVAQRDISEWLSADNSTATVVGENFESVLVPISDSSGRCVAVFEYKITYSPLEDLGDTLEGRILMAVIISVFAGIVIFVIQTLIPGIIRRSGKGGQRI